MNKNYESVVIINAALEDTQVENTITRIQDYLNSLGGEIIATERWGRKRLAYPIQKSKSGYYLILRFSAPPDAITKLERMYRLEETIYRYLTTLLDKTALEYYANQVSQEAAETEEEASELDKPKEDSEKTDG